jgi:hypothetical protein
MPVVAAFATGGSGAELLELVKRDIPQFRGIIQNTGIQPE